MTLEKEIQYSRAANMFKKFATCNWLILEIISSALEKRIARYAQGRLLDIGCGEKPYRDMAKAFVLEHVGFDHENTFHDKEQIDLFGSAYDIPVEDSSFDTVLCNDVLEHLERPENAIAEAYRVLKPNGYAIYTVPLFWHLHEQPRDFFRFTTYGLRHLFEASGFHVVEISPLTGFIATFFQELVYYIYRFRRGGRINPFWWIIPPIGFLIQFVAYNLNRIDKSYDFTAEYILVCQKKENIDSSTTDVGLTQ